MTRISVVVPSKGGEYLKHLLPALGRQTVKPDEVVLVLKDCDIGRVERLCSSYGIPSVVIEQREGYVTRAYEIGTKAAKGDIVIYTDDDVVPPDRWVQNYSKLHRAYCYASCISSRDIYWDFKLMIERPRMISPYLKPHWWVRQLFLEPPPSTTEKVQIRALPDERSPCRRGSLRPVKSVPLDAVQGCKHELQEGSPRYRQIPRAS